MTYVPNCLRSVLFRTSISISDVLKKCKEKINEKSKKMTTNEVMIILSLDSPLIIGSIFCLSVNKFDSL